MVFFYISLYAWTCFSYHLNNRNVDIESLPCVFHKVPLYVEHPQDFCRTDTDDCFFVFFQKNIYHNTCIYIVRNDRQNPCSLEVATEQLEMLVYNENGNFLSRKILQHEQRHL